MWLKCVVMLCKHGLCEDFHVAFMFNDIDFSWFPVQVAFFKVRMNAYQIFIPVVPLLAFG